MDDRMAQAQADLDARRGELVRRQRPKPGRRGGAPESIEEVLQRMTERGTTPWVSDEAVARYEAERERERRLERMRDGGVVDVLQPAMADAVARDELQATEALDWTRRWVAYQRGSEQPKGPRPVLTLIGEMGRGKTVAAAWLLANEGGRYVSAEAFCRLHAARFGPEAEECARILRTGVLVIDEIGTEEDPKRAAAALHEVIDRRQGRKLTMLLGNVSKAELRERLDPRTVDRLRGIHIGIELQGQSLRRGAL